MNEVIRIPNIENYIQEIINGELILTPRIIYITEIELDTQDLKHSKIEECIIKKGQEIISINKKNYRPILHDIWKSIPTQRIIENTTFNVKETNEHGIRGYNWCPYINLSVQDKDSTRTLKEIIKMVRVNNMSINLSIKLQTDRIVHFKIE